MARIRTLKPEITQSQSLSRVSRDARLCFVLLITQADDQGRLRGSSRMLASLLFPYDEDAPDLIDGWLEELEDEGMIRRYRVVKDDYLDLPKWEQHQRVDKASPSKHPSFEEGSREPRENSRIVLLGPRTKDQGPKDHSLGSSEPEEIGWFERFWEAYPKRGGANPKKPARDKFERAVKRGADPEALVAAAASYAEVMADKVGTEFVAQAVTWLNQERWNDQPVKPRDPATIPQFLDRSRQQPPRPANPQPSEALAAIGWGKEPT